MMVILTSVMGASGVLRRVAGHVKVPWGRSLSAEHLKAFVVMECMSLPKLKVAMMGINLMEMGAVPSAVLRRTGYVIVQIL
jgi:hypothetical protein